MLTPIASPTVIDAIVAAIKHTPVPTIPLILLALILGLPGVLIVITAHRPSYVLWMLIYLISLPIWNGVLPAYAYWKFDDFSWGDTRKTAGEKTKKAGLEYEGEFDSSKILMKRWGEFEQGTFGLVAIIFRRWNSFVQEGFRQVDMTLTSVSTERRLQGTSAGHSYSGSTTRPSSSGRPFRRSAMGGYESSRGSYINL